MVKLTGAAPASDLIGRLKATLASTQATGENSTSQRALEYCMGKAIDALTSQAALVARYEGLLAEAWQAAYDAPHGPTSRVLWSVRYGEVLDDYKTELGARKATEARLAKAVETLNVCATLKEEVELTIERLSEIDVWEDEDVIVKINQSVTGLIGALFTLSELEVKL